MRIVCRFNEQVSNERFETYAYNRGLSGTISTEQKRNCGSADGTDIASRKVGFTKVGFSRGNPIFVDVGPDAPCRPSRSHRSFSLETDLDVSSKDTSKDQYLRARTTCPVGREPVHRSEFLCLVFLIRVSYFATRSGTSLARMTSAQTRFP